ncbi:hypothetical protein IFM89_022808 [Coptis chinensis]|uniref:Uncharacterized protein n=1 Tax=Coptis chinensis TaxID=261450 RepID=A0A835I779_9MAGN|nr:hypothetical protein IFM89_022808 [Coptis chinensis]
MPLLLRFLLLSAESGNARRIVGQIRMHLMFVGGVGGQGSSGRGKGKLGVDNFEGLVLEALRSSLRFKNEYFPSFLSVSEYLLACKEQKAREFGIHMYISLFDEFNDTYSRHEILGALVTHIGSGVIYEVGSALEAMVLLASKYSQELITFSPYINGILDYIEGFNDENIHKVYEVFSHLALSARSNADSVGSSIANELFIIVHKQVSNQELRYKKMGLIGTLKIVSCLGHIDNATHLSSSQELLLLAVIYGHIFSLLFLSVSNNKSLWAPFSNNKVISDEFVNKIRKLFPSLKKHFDCAVCVLSEGDEICQEHWKFQSASAENRIYGLVVLNLDGGSYSFSLASKVLVTLESIVSSAQSFLDKLLEGSGKSNLKHKDLFGQVVSSQLYADENNDIDEDARVDMDLDVAEQPLSNCSLHDGEDGPVD